MIAPCRDCPRRGCGAYHEECPEYQRFRKERNEINRWKAQENERTRPSEGGLKYKKGIGWMMPRTRK